MEESKYSRTQLRKRTAKYAFAAGRRAKINSLPDWYKNDTREETIDWIKSLPWWRRLFNQFWM